jgi:hypothetical protein
MVKRTTNQFLLRLQKAKKITEKTDLPAANIALTIGGVQFGIKSFGI